jgi:hypothetical protein
VVPLLPIPNRTVKRFSADDSAGSRVKVGHCQALIQNITPLYSRSRGFLFSDHRWQMGRILHMFALPCALK